MEHYPTSKVVAESDIQLQYDREKIILSFFIIDRGESIDGTKYLGFDFNTKKEALPGISFSGAIVGNRAYLSHAEIFPEEYRGGGLGGLILSSLEDELARNGVRNSFAKFRNIGTLRFFLKHGYRFSEEEELTEEVLRESRCNRESTLILKEFFESGHPRALGKELSAHSALLVKELPLPQVSTHK